MGVVPYGPVFVGMNEVEENLKAELKSKLDSLGEKFGIPAESRHFLNGAPAKEIHRFADEHNADLVVLGTHGQKGVQLLLGATANSVLHGCNCDVLAVRIQEPAD
jgi:universal stress protein A